MEGIVTACVSCGHIHGSGDPHVERAPLRDDQKYVKGGRAGHYAIKQRRIVLLPKPAAGAEMIFTVPNGTAWRIDHFQAQLVTSAVINNRVVHFVITDGQGNKLYNVPALGNQVAGSTAQYSGMCSGASANFDNAQVLVLPDSVRLLQGWTLQSLTTLLDVGDQWSNIALMVREYLFF